MKFGVAFGFFFTVLLFFLQLIKTSSGLSGYEHSEKSFTPSVSSQIPAMPYVSSSASLQDLFTDGDPKLIRVKNVEDLHGDPYTVLTTGALIEKYGYSAEEHKVTTKDGYTILIYRICSSPNKISEKTNKPVVFLQPTVLTSSDVWVIMGPKTGLAFKLADEGYDVWLGNTRGNTYGRCHKNLTTSDKEFWDFSYHEIGTIDIPCMIDYVLKCTGQKSLAYIGYGMGTTVLLVLLAEKPEYNKKIVLIVCFAPIWAGPKRPGGVFSLESLNSFKVKMNSRKMYNLLPQSRKNAVFAGSVCGPDSLTLSTCSQMIASVIGPPAKDFNTTAIHEILKYIPSGEATKTLYHLGQNYKIGQMKQYDYDCVKNLEVYGCEEPPIYDLTKITVPVVIFWGKSDRIALGPNVEALGKRLSSSVSCEAVSENRWNHLDFIFGAHVVEVVYLRTINFLTQYLK